MIVSKMRRSLFVCKLFSLCVFISLLLYFFVLHGSKPESRDYEVVGWGYEMSRDPVKYLTLAPRILPKNFCENRRLLTVMVHSIPGHRKRRDMLRRIYDESYAVLKREVSLYFMLGLTRSEALQKEIDLESRKFGDIVQDGFLDARNNQTLKTLFMLKYLTYCNWTSAYLLKINDDTFINFKNLMIMLAESYPADILTGYLCCGVKPNRYHAAKRYVPHNMYPYKEFPRFLYGGGYLMSITVAKRLSEAALRLPIFYLEDVFLTGLAAKLSGIKPKHNSLFSMKKKVFNRDFCLANRLYAVFDTTFKDFLRLKLLIMDNGDCFEKSFSSAQWLLNTFFKINNPFSYRHSCD